MVGKTEKNLQKPQFLAFLKKIDLHGFPHHERSTLCYLVINIGPNAKWLELTECDFLNHKIFLGSFILIECRSLN